MKWRTDKPTADLIVALLTKEFCPTERYNRYALLSRYDEPEVHYGMENILDVIHTTVPFEAIEKWADLEEDETVTNCHQLEEAARNSWFNYEFDCGALYSKCYKDGFKAGAGWQREQFHDACYQCEKAYDNVFFKGEQHAIKMLRAEALTGEIMKAPWGALVAKTIQGIDEGKFKFGDKVKVIILKDE